LAVGFWLLAFSLLAFGFFVMIPRLGGEKELGVEGLANGKRPRANS
jgi:hypothetical protein